MDLQRVSFLFVKKFLHLAKISEFAPRKQSRFSTYKCRQTVLPVVSFHSNRCWVLFSEMLEAAAHGAVALEATPSPPGNSCGYANSSRAQFCFFRLCFVLFQIELQRKDKRPKEQVWLQYGWCAFPESLSSGVITYMTTTLERMLIFAHQKIKKHPTYSITPSHTLPCVLSITYSVFICAQLHWSSTVFPVSQLNEC